LRVIAGSAKGRPLKAGRGRHIRPTPAKIREALFDILGERIKGSSFLDLFAGSGAIGIEALSRGAREVIFVDNSGQAIYLIRHNLTTCGFEQKARLYQLEVSRALTSLRRDKESFNIIFLDPPYYTDLAEKTLGLLGKGELLAPDGVIIAEHTRHQRLAPFYGRLTRGSIHRFGDTCLSFYAIL